MREETEFKPKPMVNIGGEPVLWHIMKGYSHFGFTDFVVLTGYKSEVIEHYFRANSQTEHRRGDQTNPEGLVFTPLVNGPDWRVCLKYTGEETPTGERLRQAREILADSSFMCTYGDGLANVNIEGLLDKHRQESNVATLTRTQPKSRFGVLRIDESGRVTNFLEKPRIQDFVNMGFFVFEPEIFSLVDLTGPLEIEPLQKLAHAGSLGSYEHRGFWEPMDTYREYLELNEMWSSGKAPWKVW